MADPDFQIRGWGSQKYFFGPLGLSLVAKLVDTQEPHAPPLDLPLLVILGLISLVAFISVTLSTGREILIKIESLCQATILVFFLFNSHTIDKYTAAVITTCINLS